MELININNQNTLPEQVSVNKANIAILADEVKKLGYTLRGPYDASTEYAYNDVVEYNYCFYRVCDEDATALVGVVPTNTTYWQQITGSIRGPQGAQGPAGADGQNGTNGTNGVDGADGKNALWYDNHLSVLYANFAALLSEASHNFQNVYFNRTPEADDGFFVIVNISDKRVQMLLQYKVVSVGSVYTVAAYQNVYAQLTGDKGDTGAAGPLALTYDRTISFTYGGSAGPQLITADLAIANFNRTPNLNDDFIAILADSGVQYIAQCEVQTISGSNVTSVVANDIAKISGADGQNGTNGTDGTDGKDALVCNEVQSINYASYTLTFDKFNRTPVVNDNVLILVYDMYGNSYIKDCKITVVGATTATATVLTSINTKGAQGASSQLYQHNIRLIQTSTSFSRAYITLVIVNSYSTEYTSMTDLKNRVLGNFTSGSTSLPCSGLIESSPNSGTFFNTFSIYKNTGASETRAVYVDPANFTTTNYIVIDSCSLADTVLTL